MAGIDRVFQKIFQVTEKFEAIQEQLLDVSNRGDSKDSKAVETPRQEDNSFRSALTRAQERQSTDGKTKEAEPVTAGPKAVAADSSMEKRLMDTLRRELPKYNVPPDLALAVMQAESNFNPSAKSPKGAIGVMQLMPSTAASLGVEDEKDLYEPEVNIPAGLQHLSNLLNKYAGNEKLALAAYNAGPGAVAQHGGVPPYSETQNYIRRVFDIRRSLNDNMLSAELSPES